LGVIATAAHQKCATINIAHNGYATIFQAVQNRLLVSQLTATVAIARQDENHVVLTCGNVIVLVWLGSCVPAACATLYDFGVKLAKQCGAGKVSVVSIVQPGAIAPSPEARAALARLHEDPEQVVHRSALVLQSDGFLGAIMRSIALNVRQLASRRQGHEAFSRVDKALTWVTQDLPTRGVGPIPIAALVQAVHQFDKTKCA
jgi:hypothetical protein